jgi:hypothetical protein
MNWREDKTLIVLCAGLLFFSVMVLMVVLWKPSDGQLYTLFAGVFGQFSGALMMHLKPSEKIQQPGTTVTKVE